MVNFGIKLKQLRKEAGMTQAVLAERLGVTKSIVSYYELQERTPSPDVLIRLSRIFHVTTDYLLGIERTKTIDVSDLSDEDMRFLPITVETLRKKNKKTMVAIVFFWLLFDQKAGRTVSELLIFQEKSFFCVYFGIFS